MKRLLAGFIFVIISFSAQAQRPDLPGQLLFDFGFNSWSSKPTGTELNWFQSNTINMAYYYDFPIGNGGWTFTPALGMSWEKYAMDNNTTLISNIDADGNRTVEFVDLNEEYGANLNFDNSKIGLNYIDLPLEIRWYANRNEYSKGFRVAVGGKVSYLYSSFTKLKFKDAIDDPRMIKDRQKLNFDRLRYGVQVRAGWGGFGVFLTYELSDKWKTPPPGGANTSTLTWGVSLTAF